MALNINRNRFYLTSTTIIVLTVVALLITTTQANLRYNTIDINKTSNYKIHNTNITAELHPYNTKEFWVQYDQSDQIWKLHTYDVNTGSTAVYGLTETIATAKILLIAKDLVYIGWIQYRSPNSTTTLNLKNTIDVYSTRGKLQYTMVQSLMTTLDIFFYRQMGSNAVYSLSNQLVVFNNVLYLAVSVDYSIENSNRQPYCTSIYYVGKSLEQNPSLLTSIPFFDNNATLIKVKMRQTSNQLNVIVMRLTSLPRNLIIEDYSLDSGSIKNKSTSFYNMDVAYIDFIDTSIVSWARARDLENFDNFSIVFRFTDLTSNSEAIVDTGLSQVSTVRTSNIENLLVFYGTGVGQDYNKTYFVRAIDFRSSKLHVDRIQLPPSKELNFLVISSINRVGGNLVISGETGNHQNIIAVFTDGYSPSIFLDGLTPGQQYLVLGSILILIDLGLEIIRGRKSKATGDLQYPTASDQ